MNKPLLNYLQSVPFHYSQQVRQYSTSTQHDAEKKAVSLFHEVANRVPAYKDFLKKYGINPKTIKSYPDFQNVPPITKENYVLAYPLQDRCYDGDPTQTHAFSASSGSSGEPTFWPRGLDQEIEGAKMHELLFEHVYSVPSQKTLLVNAFGLGNWIAGMFTHNSTYLTRLHGHNLTLASPGYNQEEVFKVIKQFSPYYDQTILVCHPPILKIMLEAGLEQGINWKKLNVKFLGAGEGFSENWRDFLLKLAGQSDPLRTIINIYGSADCGLMGFETPLSIAIHRETNTNHELNRRLFASERNPYLYQFDPTLRFIETVDNQIVMTMDAVMPLIRYNIHDHGNTLSYAFALEVMAEFAPDFLKQLEQEQVDTQQWHLPFVYIFGRDQFMTTLYGVNIYPENIKAVLDDSRLQAYLTGRFIAQKDIDANQDQYLLLRLELKPGVKPTKKVSDLTQKVFVTTLKHINSEYNQVEMKFNQKMHPHIKLFTANHPKYFPAGVTKKMG